MSLFFLNASSWDKSVNRESNANNDGQLNLIPVLNFNSSDTSDTAENKSSSNNDNENNLNSQNTNAELIPISAVDMNNIVFKTEPSKNSSNFFKYFLFMSFFSLVFLIIYVIKARTIQFNLDYMYKFIVKNQDLKDAQKSNTIRKNNEKHYIFAVFTKPLKIEFWQSLMTELYFRKENSEDMSFDYWITKKLKIKEGAQAPKKAKKNTIEKFLKKMINQFYKIKEEINTRILKKQKTSNSEKTATNTENKLNEKNTTRQLKFDFEPLKKGDQNGQSCSIQINNDVFLFMNQITEEHKSKVVIRTTEKENNTFFKDIFQKIENFVMGTGKGKIEENVDFTYNNLNQMTGKLKEALEEKKKTSENSDNIKEVFNHPIYKENMLKIAQLLNYILFVKPPETNVSSPAKPK
jgi:predicted outer membrane protein